VCCRYWADESPEIREIVEEMNKSPLVDKWQQTTGITTYGEVRPTNVVPVIVSNRAGVRAVFPMKWGFTGRTLLMNARTETAPVKATFRNTRGRFSGNTRGRFSVLTGTHFLCYNWHG